MDGVGITMFTVIKGVHRLMILHILRLVIKYAKLLSASILDYSIGILKVAVLFYSKIDHS